METDGVNEETARQSFGFHSLTWRLVAWILGSVGLVYLGTLLYSDSLSRDLIVAGAENEAVNVTRAYVKDIGDGLRSVEERTELLAEVLGTLAPSKDELDEVLRTFVSGSDIVYGSTVAFAPRAFRPDVEHFAPYYHLQGTEVIYKDLAADSYRYWEWNWYTTVASSQRPRWSEPYVDEGGGNVRMVTYSVPIFLGGDETQELKGVLTADVSLDWLHQRMKTLRVGESGYGAILSQRGYVISHPDETLLQHRTVAELEEREPAPKVAAIVERMMRGESGFELIHDRYLGKPARMTYAPIGHAGWSLAVIYPEDELMADVNFVTWRQSILSVTGLLLLVAVVIGLSRRMTKPIKALAGSAGRIATGDLDLELPTSQSEDEIGALTRAFGNMRDSLKTHIRDLKETTAAKERLESELKIARKIQMDMLPKGNLGGDKEGFELAATLVSAREVGGDLYYHFLRDGRVAFLVGDVSGKGVPAALFMARTKTLFETIARNAGDVGEALAVVNQSLCRENEAGMFVTVFAGVFDPSTGKLKCAAGGHDPPALLSGDGTAPRFLDVEGGPLLGLLDAAEYPTHEVELSSRDSIVITTDGVSEARNAGGDFFGEERLLSALANMAGAGASEISEKLLVAVRDYAGNAPQSDDITIMTLRYAPVG